MDAVTLIAPGRYRSKVTSVQIKRDCNGEIYFASILGRITEGEHKGEMWMDLLRPAHAIPAIEHMDRRKLGELLSAAGVETPELAKGQQLIAHIGVRTLDEGKRAEKSCAAIDPRLIPTIAES
jgi:hypothetical protein